MVKKIYRRKEVAALFGYADSTLYDRIAKGLFPKADVRLGPQIVGWTEEVLESTREKMIAESAARDATR